MSVVILYIAVISRSFSMSSICFSSVSAIYGLHCYSVGVKPKLQIIDGEFMLTLDEIREKLSDVNMSKIARETGLSRPTVYKLLNGLGNFKYDTVVKVSEYLKGKD